MTSDESRLSAALLNGQQFLTRKRGEFWTGQGQSNYVQRIMIKQIKFVSIPVRDQNRALDFYTDKLGFTIITDQPFDEKQHWIELRIPKAETRVVLFTPGGRRKTDRLVHEHVLHLRRYRQNVREIEKAWRGVRRAATKTAVGHLRYVQGQRRKQVRTFV